MSLPLLTIVLGIADGFNPCAMWVLVYLIAILLETKDKKKLVRDKVKLPNEKGEYNIEYYLERQILPAIENIFQIFDINTKEVIEGKKQTQLGDF